MSRIFVFRRTVLFSFSKNEQCLKPYELKHCLFPLLGMAFVNVNKIVKNNVGTWFNPTVIIHQQFTLNFWNAFSEAPLVDLFKQLGTYYSPHILTLCFVLVQPQQETKVGKPRLRGCVIIIDFECTLSSVKLNALVNKLYCKYSHLWILSTVMCEERTWQEVTLTVYCSIRPLVPYHSLPSCIGSISISAFYLQLLILDYKKLLLNMHRVAHWKFCYVQCLWQIWLAES